MTTEDAVHERSRNSDDETGELIVAALVATLPVDALALSFAGVLPDSVSLLSAEPLLVVVVAAAGLVFGAVAANDHRRPADERNRRRVAALGLGLAVPAVGANIVFGTGAYLFAHVLFSGTGYGVLYLYEWSRT